MSKLSLRTIASGSIDLGQLPFSLYCTLPGGGMILFCKRNMEITPKDLKALRQRDRIFYIKGNDSDNYIDYVSDRLDEIVHSNNMRIKDKAEIIYDIGKRNVKALFKEPRSGKIVKQSRKFVGSLIDLILKNPQVSESLLLLSSSDPYLISHSVNVCTFCLLIGERIVGRKRHELQNLGVGGLLHDIGKAMVPNEILNKPGKLTDEEFKQVKMHTEYGYDIGKEHDLEEEALEAIRSHHERVDGSGYPEGLQGEDIPQFARIAGVVDVYDALTTNRAYRNEMQHFQALEEMAKDMHMYDLPSFNALLKIVLRDEILMKDFQDKYSIAV